MTFKLSKRSLRRLEGVDESLAATVKLAISVRLLRRAPARRCGPSISRARRLI